VLLQLVIWVQERPYGTTGLIGEYQSDSSSKRPAPSAFDAYNSNKRTTKNALTNVIFTIDKGRSISGISFVVWDRAGGGGVYLIDVQRVG